MTGGTSCLTTGIWDIPVFKYDVVNEKLVWGMYMGSLTYHDYSERVRYSKYDSGIVL